MAMKVLTAWSQALAQLMRLEDPQQLSTALTASLMSLRPGITNWLMAIFHADKAPSILGYSNAAKEYDEHYAERPYMLDPFFTAYRQGREGFFHLSDLAPDDFRRSEYFRTYYRHLKVGDEAGYLARLENGDCVHLSLGTSGPQRFSREDLNWFSAISPVLLVLLARLATAEGEALGLAFAHLGFEQLTEREREVATLMLQGHSAKSMARLLEIAPGTVRNHIKQVYAKLGVSSHRELFMRLLGSLGLAGEAIT